MTRLVAQPFADGFSFLEAPKWHDGLLWTSDVLADEVHALSVAGRRERVIKVPNRPTGLGFLSDGSLVIVTARNSRLMRLHGDLLDEYADLSRHAAGWLNDFAVDARDRIYVGNFGYDFVGGAPRQTTNIHRVDPDRSVTTAASGLDFPNGSVVIDGGRTLVVAETWEARITAFDIDEAGGLSNRRVFADLGHRQPDGLCADADGGVWAGIYNTGEFVRVVDGGRITATIQAAKSAVSCALGGPHGRTLFMTVFNGTEQDFTAGGGKAAVLAAEVEVPGPAHSSSDDAVAPGRFG